MSHCYLDASAVLAVAFNQLNAAEARERIDAARRRTSSRLLVVEIDRAIIRLALDAPGRTRDVAVIRRNARRLLMTTDLIDVTREICDLAGRIGPRIRLRALDAIHLATFQLVRTLDPEVEMLTLDRRLQDALSHL
jgi:predicted nucleic acid-binding protein